MMGALAGRLVELGGKVHGIIPKALLRHETSAEKPSYGETTVVGDMHTRKRLMADKSKAFIALPGGFGTMEELMEVHFVSFGHLCLMIGRDVVATRHPFASHCSVERQWLLYTPPGMGQKGR